LGRLFERCRADHWSWINGDAGPYVLPEDGSILGAVGGFSLGGSDTASRQQSVAAQWLSGTGDLEFVNGAVSGDTAWLAMIERARVVFKRDVGEQRWDLRVTEVFRRVGDGWERVHRHADPLVDRRSVASAVQLLEPNN
jgi:ketosteroid isomerase-like protein